MEKEEIKLFVDLFSPETQAEIRKQLPKRWGKKIFTLLLLLWVAAVILFDFDRPCVEVFCQDPYGITHPDRIVVKGTIDEPVGWRCTEIDDGDCMGYAPVGGDFNPAKHEVDADAEWRKCLCWERDWKITSPYFNWYFKGREL